MSTDSTKEKSLGEIPIAINERERNLLLNEVMNAENYLEFGSGGSTFLMLLLTPIKK